MLFIFISCTDNNTRITEKKILVLDSVLLVEKIDEEVLISDLEIELIKKGLVNVSDIDSTILINIKYSTTDNFMNEDMYGDFNKAYLQKDVALKLKKAQFFLHQNNSELSLLVYDAVRPRHVQQKMWDGLNMSFSEKIKFVSNPKNGSLHNYGAAVDVTLSTTNGKPLDMGTPYDFIGELAYPSLETQNLENGTITKLQINNRKLLRSVMKKAGFFGIQSEWWHFNSCRRSEAKKRYEIVE